MGRAPGSTEWSSDSSAFSVPSHFFLQLLPTPLCWQGALWMGHPCGCPSLEAGCHPSCSPCDPGLPPALTHTQERHPWTTSSASLADRPNTTLHQHILAANPCKPHHNLENRGCFSWEVASPTCSQALLPIPVSPG